MNIKLCEGCIKDLKEYNPYVVPIKILKVSKENCDNTKIGNNKKPSYVR